MGQQIAMKVKIKLLKPEAKVPTYGRDGDAGLDLYSCDDYKIAPGERHIFYLGFALELPPGMVGLIWDRSGMAAKFGIHSLAGVVDSNYRGELGVTLLNTADTAHQIRKGDRVAQLVIQRYEAAEFEIAETLSDSERGANHHLSSGR